VNDELHDAAVAGRITLVDVKLIIDLGMKPFINENTGKQ
jgi:hypothetical protein